VLIASVDPHKSKIALVEWYYDGTLADYDLVRSNLVEYCLARVRRYEVLVIEKMQVYPNERVKRPNDLLAVSKTVGLCHVMGRQVVEYAPRTWKGQVPKDKHHPRIKDALSDKELAILGKQANQPDVLDAVGIGLKYFRRI